METRLHIGGSSLIHAFVAVRLATPAVVPSSQHPKTCLEDQQVLKKNRRKESLTCFYFSFLRGCGYIRMEWVELVLLIMKHADLLARYLLESTLQWKPCIFPQGRLCKKWDVSKISKIPWETIFSLHHNNKNIKRSWRHKESHGLKNITLHVSIFLHMFSLFFHMFSLCFHMFPYFHGESPMLCTSFPHWNR